jgi:uncharacterized membrane protein
MVHAAGIENFWSLLKRTLGGTYVSVEPFHIVYGIFFVAAIIEAPRLFVQGAA